MIMEMLISQTEFDSKKSKDLIPLKCIKCSKLHYRPKKLVTRVLFGKLKNTLTGCFCSHQCCNEYKNNESMHNCKLCGISVNRVPSQIKKAKYIFCSRICAAKYYNQKNIKFASCMYCKTNFRTFGKSKKYCSILCVTKHKKQKIYDKIKNGIYFINHADNKTIKSYLLSTRGHQCEDCKLQMWKNKQIPLTIHHINGNSLDNKLENVQLLCWNCHAMTENYGRKNKKSARKTRYKNF